MNIQRTIVHVYFFAVDNNKINPVKLSQFNSWDLQQLVLLLQIDPQNVVVEVLEENVKKHKSSVSNCLLAIDGNGHVFHFNCSYYIEV